MMIIELTVMALCFMLVGLYLGMQLGKARNNVQVQLPEWLTYSLDMFRK